MMYSEFDKLCKEMDAIEIEADDYKNIIEPVYMYHPIFNVEDAKKRAVKMWKTFGIVIFKDMLKRSDDIQKMDEMITKKEKEIERLKLDITNLSTARLSSMYK